MIHDEGQSSATTPGILAIAEAVRAEHPTHLAADLRETVSAAAIQLHPGEADVPVPTRSEPVASDTPGAEPRAEAEAQAQDVATTATAAPLNDVVLPAPDAPTASGTAPRDPGLAGREGSGRDPEAGSIRAEAFGWRTLSAEATAAPGGQPGLVRMAVETNGTLWSYMQSESEAALAYLRALGQARSPAELVTLHAREIVRAVAANLTLQQAIAACGNRALEA